MPALARSDATVAYDVRGDGSAVTLLHGFSQARSVWDELVSPTHRRIGVDLRGHGGTRTVAGAAHDMEACSADLIALWDALGVERSHLAGYSMGGRLALHVACAYPERLASLTVISSHAGLEGSERRARRLQDKALAARIESEGIAWFAGYWGALPMFATLRARRPDLADRLDAMRRANDPRGLAASLRGMGAGAMQTLWPELARVTCAALVVAGADDARYVRHGERLAATLRHGQLEVVAGAGHAVHLEQPVRFVHLFETFIDRCDGRGR